MQQHAFLLALDGAVIVAGGAVILNLVIGTVRRWISTSEDLAMLEAKTKIGIGRLQ